MYATNHIHETVEDEFGEFDSQEDGDSQGAE
jgi:hypothetical protein